MSQDPTSARLDETLVHALARSRAPGAQAALVRQGEVLWTGSAGLAELESEVPVTGSTVFCLASLGKTMVAALALRLVEDGRLDLEAPIAAVLGDDVPGATVVTARMLLTHTSGYPDLYESPELLSLFPPEDGRGGEAYDPDRAFTFATLATGLREPVEPGTRWAYSNTGYIVLTEVLSRIVGEAHGLQAAWRSLVGPRPGDDVLTMDRSAVPLDRLAHGYDERPDGTLVHPYAAYRATGIPTDLFGLPFGDGLFAGTAAGVALFLDALFVGETLLDPATVELMTTATPQAAAGEEPEQKTYGMGTFAATGPGGAWQGHRGRYAGFSTLGAAQRERGLTLAVLCNGLTDDIPAVQVWNDVAGLLS